MDPRNAGSSELNGHGELGLPFNKQLDWIVTCNAFQLLDKYYLKEISLVSEHARFHYRVKVPGKILKVELSDKEQKTVEYCEDFLHKQKLKNELFDTPLYVVTNQIKYLQYVSPHSTFYVKGDLKLQKYLIKVCHVKCDLLNSCPPVQPWLCQIDSYPFCPLHVASSCCFFKAKYYFDLVTNSTTSCVTLQYPASQQNGHISNLNVYPEREWDDDDDADFASISAGESSVSSASDESKLVETRRAEPLQET